MPSHALPGKRRLQVVVKESACPGLIAKLRQIPEGDENVFVRAVLTEWFDANSGDENVADAVRRLVCKHRIAEFAGATGFRLDEHRSTRTDSAVKPPVQVTTPAPVLSQMAAALAGVPKQSPRADDTAFDSQLAAFPPASLPTALPKITAPAFEVDFDPDQF